MPNASFTINEQVKGHARKVCQVPFVTCGIEQRARAHYQCLGMESRGQGIAVVERYKGQPQFISSRGRLRARYPLAKVYREATR